MAVFKPQTIPEKIMFSVKRIEASAGGRSWVGTGYAFSEKHDENLSPLIVTNRHVAADAEQMRILFHTLTDGELDGGYTYLEIRQQNGFAIMHPNPAIDLAIVGVGQAMNEWVAANPGRSLFWIGLEAENMIGDDGMADLDACEPVTMVGCPSGLWDEANGFPLFRRGVTASHPGIDFEGRPEFVVDIGVYSGSSGSPVFILDQGLIKTSKTENNFSPGGRFGLLGTLWGGPRITEQGELVVLPAPTDNQVGVQTPIRMHLGYVIKSRELNVLLEEFRNQMER